MIPLAEVMRHAIGVAERAAEHVWFQGYRAEGSDQLYQGSQSQLNYGSVLITLVRTPRISTVAES